MAIVFSLAFNTGSARNCEKHIGDKLSLSREPWHSRIYAQHFAHISLFLLLLP